MAHSGTKYVLITLSPFLLQVRPIDRSSTDHNFEIVQKFHIHFQIINYFVNTTHHATAREHRIYTTFESLCAFPHFCYISQTMKEERDKKNSRQQNYTKMRDNFLLSQYKYNEAENIYNIVSESH